ncbi:MAG: hypothetical protein ACREGI_04580 [Candidatus Levyibacteriota bacterium]
MKKIIIISILVLLLFISTQQETLAVTATPSPSTSPSPSPTASADQNAINQQIDNLKERIASRVAQLNLVEKRGTIGTVTDTSDTQISLTDVNGNTVFIDVDELTKFSSPSAKGSFGISDITKGSTVGVLGLYNKESRRILARFVDVLVLPKMLSGTIVSIDKTNYYITLQNEQSDSYTIEVEDITKTSSYTKDGGVVKSGFSKVQVGQRIYAVGFTDVKDKTKIIASRIILFPDLTANPNIRVVPTDALMQQTQVTPSTGSGKKLVPIVK